MLQKAVCWARLLTAQKPISSPVGGKETLLYFRCQRLGAGWLMPVQRPMPTHHHHQHDKLGGESFNRQSVGGGLHAEMARSALTVIFKLVISGLTSIILVALGTVNLHFQGPFVPSSLRPVLGTVAAHVLGVVWSSCITCPPGVLYV